MNSTFKVVFNKARGALMVVNEVTSSVQAKGTKTVVATAVAAMIAGVATAAETAKTTVTFDPSAQTQITEFDGYVSIKDATAGLVNGALRIANKGTAESPILLKDYSFTNNKSAGTGGALEIQKSVVTFEDAIIKGNEAADLGGAIRMAGSTVTVKAATKDAVYVGNKANTNPESGYQDVGGFAYISGQSELILNADKGNIVIGDANSADKTIDSIASEASQNVDGTAQHKVTIKSGQGKSVTINSSMEAFIGDITVDEGATFELAGGFGSIDNKYAYYLEHQNEQNGKFGDRMVKTYRGATATLNANGTASIGDLVINRTGVTIDEDVKPGTALNVGANGKLTVKSITVEGSTFTTYKVAADQTAAKEGEKLFVIDNANEVMPAYGTLTVANGGTATVKEDITVGTDGTFDINGAVTVKGGVNTAAPVAASESTTAKAGGVVKLANGSVLTVKGASLNAGSLIGEQASLVLEGNFDNTGKLNVKDITIADGGKLSALLDLTTAGQQKTFTKFETITVEEGGTFDAKELNGMFKTGLAPDSTKKEVADALVFMGGSTMSLDGGKVTVGGKPINDKKVVVTGQNSKMVIADGNYTVGALKVADNGKLTIEGGSLEVSGDFQNYENSVENAGNLTISAAGIGLEVTKANEVTTIKTADTFKKIVNKATVNESEKAGIVTVTGMDKIAIDSNKVQELRAAIAGTDGKVNMTGIKVNVVGNTDGTKYNSEKNTLDQSVVASLDGVKTEQFKSTTVTGVTADKKIAGGSFGAVQGTKAVLTGSTSELELNNSGLVAHDADGKAIEFDLAGGKLVTTGAAAQIGKVTGAGTLGVAAGKLSVAVDRAATATDEATYHTINAKAIEVADGAAFESQGDVTLSDGGNITGTAVIKTLTAGTRLNVGTEEQAGSLVVNELVGGTIFADPAWNAEGAEHPSEVAVKTVAAAAQVEAGQNSIAVIGSEDVQLGYKALAKSGFKIANTEAEDAAFNAVNSVLYVTGNPTVDAETSEITAYNTVKGKLVASNNTEGPTTVSSTNTVQVDRGSLLIVNMANFDKTGATKVFENALTLDGKLYLDNIVKGDKVNLNGSVSASGAYFTGDMMMAPEATATAGVNVINMRDKDDLIASDFDIVAGFDAAYSYFENGASLGTSSSARFNNMLWSKMTTFVDEDGNYDLDRMADVADDVASIVGTAGMANVTLDAISQFNDTVAARTSILARNGEGVNVWADVNGGKFEGKKVMDGAGYSADIYAGVLGADVTVACGAKVGAALTIGTADTDSKNTSAVTSMDSDLFGLSVYTSKTFGDIWNVAADFGYMQLSNEVTEKTYGIGKFDADSDAFTFGIRGEVLTKAGALDIVPHAGLRYTRISLDQFEAGFVTDADSMNVFQMPVGITVSGELEVAGWNVAPAFDLTFTPTWGDKDVEAKLGVAGGSVTESGAMRVLDSNVVNATLGVAAQNGAWTFGLDYKLGVGSDDRMNNSFNARVNYAF